MSAVARTVLRGAGRPVTAYLDARFGRIDDRLERLDRTIDRIGSAPAGPTHPDPLLVAEVEQARHLGRVDVRRHNEAGRPPTFDRLESQAVSAAQCEHPSYLSWLRLLEDVPGDVDDDGLLGAAYNRKLWEWGYIAEAVTQAGLMLPGKRALGFGCGTEPMPALFARAGLEVVATDQASDEGQQDWSGTGQLMAGLESLSRPHLLSDADLAERVRVRAVDMNDVPADLGTYDVVWSSCVIEHLGSPQRGLEFVLQSADLLEPGGIAIHTTELELVPMASSQDYGHCAVYVLDDLLALEADARSRGLQMTINPYVSLDAPQDRWISMALTGHAESLRDCAHLKLVLGDSVTTSFGLVIRRP